MPHDAHPLFGATRTRLGPRHALIAPDGHMDDALPGWSGARTTVLVSPRLGAAPAPGFVQLLVRLAEGGGTTGAHDDLERFVFVLEGRVRVDAGDRDPVLAAGGYAFLPTGTGLRLRAVSEARVLLFERPYEPAADAPAPPVLFGDADAVAERPFLDLDGLGVRSLLPGDTSFDMSVSLMRYRPGAALPMVETHEAEHGLLLLEGRGVLRLEDAWYPIRAGDAAWLGPYCPQWFAALGDEDLSYLLYKDGRRGPWPATARAVAPH